MIASQVRLGHGTGVANCQPVIWLRCHNMAIIIKILDNNWLVDTTNRPFRGGYWQALRKS